MSPAEPAASAFGPRVLSFTVPAELEGMTVGRVLRLRFRMAKGFISSLKPHADGIVLNGQKTNTDRRVRRGDVLAVRVDDRGQGNPAAPVPLPLCVRYEDADLAVVEKPAGILVHGPEGGAPTLANALAARWAGAPFHPVHRLDRGTSGLLAVARSAYAAELLRQSLHTEDFRREYLALAHGVPAPREGRIRLPLGAAEDAPRRRCVCPEGQAADTAYRVLFAFPGGCLLRLRLYTGRTHQIRAHLSALGHPLYGDTLYGAPAGDGISRPALHAAFLSLVQPVTGERLSFASPLPEDLVELLRFLSSGG